MSVNGAAVREVLLDDQQLGKTQFKIMGISLPLFIVVSLVVLSATFMGVLPKGMIGAFPLMMIIGAILNEVGNRLPIVKDYLGGGPIVVIFGSAALVTYGLLPEASSDIMSNFIKGEGFLSFYIAALITGSILGMDKKLLIRAAVRYFPVILGGVVAALGLAGLVGSLMGYGGKEAILYVALPIMGGGMGAGAVPLSQIFGDALSVDPAEMLSKMVPALALGNAMAIVIAGLLNRLGKKMPSLSGEGKLMINQVAVTEGKQVESAITYKSMGTGLLLATTFFVLGNILAKFIPIHSYALMIIAVALVKMFGLMPKQYEESAAQWFKFVMANFTPALLVGIGVAYTDLNAVINAFSFTYIVLVFFTVLGSVIGSGIVGKFTGFYPIEAAITGGLCMANMGGTGDVAVLSSANRMELMPFAQISSRIGGAFMLLLATAVLNMIF
ncbi:MULTISPECIES: 2-hydroxycarboxylate transporter family protein [unclassified Fusibacter]|uniref:2-hydroxycarboxylate transporter family protein n=1 Tax=unclassified Fusibacter TaxID=2624464 RepID=UPI0010109219|nr:MULTISPECIES: 2-hydroxycarboxylate transporter family protein [unclassified Fusibacter]MCK8059161.1 2-hydroxycarboxylate transporter family protein [Fusibacter sp. A2]NPE22570.1 2-hydroxycarboxylate transporter family protein [Fusibacter sp. A1]RXV60672.1 citrate:sodium symporter [Fusibacter sp. A1]